ncbi:NAD(P)H-dependent oxidoreductase [Aliiroseovarius subalbicans]|uniref:FMN-dependent NADH-azoreductase n=1 Tax=Aliiroseovarius subalbicans TaxID=2925840 RepID=UPI001F5799B9|nr:NAD(P)H-dependent oxidoreductase [Aliiroseovarius subalbicans]MCI2400694.1 NAD(P)H-dependent oxidoreductase [Aliiroseovarius subalbicans]
MTHILRIDASARHQGSVTRGLTDRLIARFPDAQVTTRDLANGIPHLDESWVGATFTPPEMRSAAQAEALTLSDTLVAEVEAADVLVIGSATYNFNTPAALKAWIDQIARVGVTFRYSETGPEGLLTGKKAIIVVASGGTPIGAPNDFTTPYLRYVLGFMGITDVTFVDAAGGADDVITQAGLALDALDLAA